MSEDKPNRPRIQVEKVHNMTGSTAGAGSGEFHNYSLHKQRERSRLSTMEYEARQEQRTLKFETQKKELETKADKATEKRRLERLKKKQNKIARKQTKLAQSLNSFKSDGSFLEQFMKNKQLGNEQQENPPINGNEKEHEQDHEHGNENDNLNQDENSSSSSEQAISEPSLHKQLKIETQSDRHEVQDNTEKQLN